MYRAGRLPEENVSIRLPAAYIVMYKRYDQRRPIRSLIRNERNAKRPADKLTNETMFEIWSGLSFGVTPNARSKLGSCVNEAVVPSSQPEDELNETQL
jgi:hypothetical protein